MTYALQPSPDDWHSPADSLADRFPTKFRSKASTQGVLVTTGREPRQVYWDSLGEFGVLATSLARRDIVDVREQQEAVYRDAEGVVRRHFFDFVVTFADGTRRALAYKPRDRAEKIGFVDFLTDLAGRISPEVADEIVPLTEFDLPRATVQNAILIHDCQRDPSDEADEAVLAALAEFIGHVSIADLRDATGLGGDAYRAIVRLIGSGEIVMKGTARICGQTLVRSASREDAR